jgi:hypothetical protein
MQRPETIIKAFLRESHQRGSGTIGISTIGLNLNPRLKKYYFWVYHYDMQYSSAKEVFWKDEHRLSLKKAIANSNINIRIYYKKSL